VEEQMDKVKNIIYKAKNEQRKCFYVGYTSNDLTYRKYHHKNVCFVQNKNNKFYKFLRKYGWDSFIWDILAVYSTPEELPQAEIFWLAEQKKEFSDWECLNLTDGGDGGLNPSKETREKISQKLKERFKNKKNHPMFGKKNPSLTKRNKTHKLVGKNNPNFGKKWSEEVIEKMRKVKLGKHLTEQHRRKIGDSIRGIKNGNYGKTGEKHPLWGKFWETHPVFGKHWKLTTEQIKNRVESRKKNATKYQ
jgi:group I intron endonuclease